MSFEQVGIQLVAQDAAAFNQSLASADKAVADFGSQADNTFKQMPGLSDIAVGALHKIGEVAVDAFMQAGQAAVGFFKDSISVAGDFESGMNNFAAVAGKALDESGLSLKDFRDQFIQLGKELPVSTSDVQKAATEMVKGGIEPATIAAGGLKQVIQFAAAAMDGDLVAASTVAAKALGGWVDQAADAKTKADFLAHSTDLLSKAANASTVDVKDLALGLYNVQGTAKLAGVSFDETVTTLAELAPSFASSADAGTAFKTFLARLQPTTKPAIAAMQALNLVTKDGQSLFYDAQGNFVGMAKASQLLEDATKGLNQAQKEQILQTIFGQDAIRVAAVLTEKGAAGYNAMTDALNKQNSVADMAKQKQAGFNTALDNAKGSLEALQITIGSALLPVLTDLLNNYIAPAINLFTDLASDLFDADGGIGVLSDDIREMTGIDITPLITGVSSLVDWFQTGLLPAAVSVGDYFDKNIAPILDNLATALFPLLSAAVQIAAGLWTDVLYPALHFAWDAFNTLILPILADVAAWLAKNLPPAIQATADFLTGTLFPAIHDVYDFLDKNLIPIFADVVTWLRNNIPPAIQKATDFWNNELYPALSAVYGFVNTKVIPIFQTVTGTTFPDLNTKTQAVADSWNNTLWPALDKVWNYINTNIIPLIKALANVFEAVLGKATSGYIDLLDKGLMPGLQRVSGFINANLLPDLTNTKDGLQIVSDFIDRTIGPTLKSFGNDVLKGVGEWFDRITQGIQTAVEWLNKLADTIRNLPGLPSEYEGHSPPPIAKWMDSIADSTAMAAGAMGMMGGGVSQLPASPAAMMAASNSSTTYNQQRTANITYHTAVAPPAPHSLAIANALAY